MLPYTIEVSRIEELQMIRNMDELDAIFAKAQSAIVNGVSVYLARKQADGSLANFDELTTLDDLDNYRRTVYRYL
jgi:hypothetical protein